MGLRGCARTYTSPFEIERKGQKIAYFFRIVSNVYRCCLEFFFFKIDLAVSEIIITLFLWMMILGSRFVPIVKEIW